MVGGAGEEQIPGTWTHSIWPPISQVPFGMVSEGVMSMPRI